MPEQPSASRSPGSGPPTSPPRGRSAHRTPTRSRWTSARPHVATTNVSAIARDPGPTTRLRSAPGSLVFGIQSPHEVFKHTSVSQKPHGMPFLFSCIEKIHASCTHDKSRLLALLFRHSSALNILFFFAPRTPTREGPKRCAGPDVRWKKIYKNKAKPSLLQGLYR